MNRLDKIVSERGVCGSQNFNTVIYKVTVYAKVLISYIHTYTKCLCKSPCKYPNITITFDLCLLILYICTYITF